MSSETGVTVKIAPELRENKLGEVHQVLWLADFLYTFVVSAC